MTQLREKATEGNKEVSFSILPIASKRATEDDKKMFMELQIQMVTSSINHEYARREYDKTSDFLKKEEISSYLDKCIEEYKLIRERLRELSPLRLLEFERDLLEQKRKFFSHHEA